MVHHFGHSPAYILDSPAISPLSPLDKLLTLVIPYTYRWFARKQLNTAGEITQRTPGALDRWDLGQVI